RVPRTSVHLGSVTSRCGDASHRDTCTRGESMSANRMTASRTSASRMAVNRRAVRRGAAALGGVAALRARLPAVAAGQCTDTSVGGGIGDMTGEPLGAGMNGYADTEQLSVGLHLRQRARAFVFADSPSSPRFLHVTAEIGLVFQSFQQEVLRRLAAEFGDTYHEGNVAITATHTHVEIGRAS